MLSHTLLFCDLHLLSLAFILPGFYRMSSLSGYRQAHYYLQSAFCLVVLTRCCVLVFDVLSALVLIRLPIVYFISTNIQFFSFPTIAVFLFFILISCVDRKQNSPFEIFRVLSYDKNTIHIMSGRVLSSKYFVDTCTS